MGKEDLYTLWLKIPAGVRPPDYYTLLGLEMFCEDSERIERAAYGQIEKLRPYEGHGDRDKREACARMMNEVAEAQVTLSDAEKRREYDESLKAAKKTDDQPSDVVESSGEYELIPLESQEDVSGRSEPEPRTEPEPESGPEHGRAAERQADQQADVDQRSDGKDESPDCSKLKAALVIVLAAFVVYAGYLLVAYLRLTKAGDVVVNSIGMKLVYIPPGEFMMGSRLDESGRDSDEGPEHPVRISQGFWMGQYEVTQKQYNDVMSKKRREPVGNHRHAKSIRWANAVEFCKKLSEKEGKIYRLPTEAEWEYACRAGTTTAYNFGDSSDKLGNYAWYGDHRGRTTHQVGQKQPNAWGLYDMHGNVGEWCLDWYDPSYYKKSPTLDPPGPVGVGKNRVLRGGAFSSTAEHCRSAGRSSRDPSKAHIMDGFRVVLCSGDKDPHEAAVAIAEAEKREKERLATEQARLEAERVEAELLAKAEAEAKAREEKRAAAEQAKAELLAKAEAEAEKRKQAEAERESARLLEKTEAEAEKRKQEEARQAKANKIAELLAEAKANDSKANIRVAWLALENLLRLEPSHSEALALRTKIESYYWGDVITNSIGMKLVCIPAGEFMMGSPPNESHRDSDEGPQHLVRIGKNFWMGQYEVTRGQYEKIMGKNPSNFKGGNNSVIEANRHNAETICKKLSQREGISYRLPTEAEWEYACRAGTSTAYSFGDSSNNLGSYAWCISNSSRTTHPAGQKHPNRIGLCDMHGNVWEWCLDWYSPTYYQTSPSVDPPGPLSGVTRVIRGGSYNSTPETCRSASRNSLSVHKAAGFRMVWRAGEQDSPEVSVAVAEAKKKGLTAVEQVRAGLLAGAMAMAKARAMTRDAAHDTAEAEAKARAADENRQAKLLAKQKARAKKNVQEKEKKLARTKARAKKVTLSSLTTPREKQQAKANLVKVAADLAKARRVLKALTGRKRTDNRTKENSKEQERAKRTARLLAEAKDYDNKDYGSVAVMVLEELLELEPSHREALALKKKIEGYYWGDVITNSIGMKLINVPRGKFIMGQYEVTQGQYKKIMHENPSQFKGDNHPVEKVTWYDAVEFCRRLSQKEGKVYRLPTEAQWEYACRAGTSTAYSCGDSGDSLGNYAWYRRNSSKKTHPVGQKQPNSFGFYDMHGNVLEWSADSHNAGHEGKSSSAEALGPTGEVFRVLRGGSWSTGLDSCRSEFCYGDAPSRSRSDFGFRVVLDASGEE